MLNFDNDTFEDDIKFEKFDFSSFPFESYERQRPPFLPFPGGNFPPLDDYPPDFNIPNNDFSKSNIPKSAPPNFTPNKNTKGIQSFSQDDFGPGPKSVHPGSIRFCLFRFTYIWERNGRNYWAFLVNINRRAISGFRWLRRNWVYFSINLRRIDSFICYNRSENNDDCTYCDNTRHDEMPLTRSLKNYSLNQTTDINTQTLMSINIPEIKEDFTSQNIGNIDNINVMSDIPCMKYRDIIHEINLEISYPNKFDKSLKNTLKELYSESCADACRIFKDTRNNDGFSTSLEDFNSSLSLIPKALKTFSDSFNSKLKQLNLSSEKSKLITWSIRQEQFNSDWKPYTFNNILF